MDDETFSAEERAEIRGLLESARAGKKAWKWMVAIGGIIVGATAIAAYATTTWRNVRGP